jgi:hypothetical protein
MSLLNDPFYDRIILRHFEKNTCGEIDNMYSKRRRLRFFMFFCGSAEKRHLGDHKKGSFSMITCILQMPYG